MKYLLDVNALIAMGVVNHQFRVRVMTWVGNETSPQLFTCPITELGFVRVLSNAQAYGYTVEQARNLLLEIKTNPSFPLVFIPDNHDIAKLPGWVMAPRQITDGHLLQLAIAHEALLATVDEGIPGAYLIP
jgi:uncharacterized protein